MASTNIVLYRLKTDHTSLEAVNQFLGNGQEVIVTGIPDAIHPARKIGNGTDHYNFLPFIDIVFLQVNVDYTLMQSHLTIEGTEVEITNISTLQITLTLSGGDTTPLLADETKRYRYINNSWVSVHLTVNITDLDPTFNTLTTTGNAQIGGDVNATGDVHANKVYDAVYN